MKPWQNWLPLAVSPSRRRIICNPTELTAHANQRCAQRNLSDSEVRYILENGTRLHNAGAVFVYLREKDVPYEDRRDQRVAQLVGTTVLLTADGQWIKTAYRDPKAAKRDRRKTKHEFRKAA